MAIPWQKHPITDSRFKREFGNNGKTHSHLNLKPMMILEQNTCILKHLHKTHSTFKVKQVIKNKYNETSKLQSSKYDMKHIKATWSNTKQSYENDYNDHIPKQIIFQTCNQ